MCSLDHFFDFQVVLCAEEKICTVLFIKEKVNVVSRQLSQIVVNDTTSTRLLY